MGYLQEWKAWSARVEGLAEAVRCLTSFGSDTSSASTPISSAANESFVLLKNYLEAYRDVLPQKVVDCLKMVFQKDYTRQREVRKNSPQFLATELLTIRAEVDYLLSNPQIAQARLVERAFEHLQRSIIVDESMADRWKKAFNKGETSCEKLGAVHLLAHGLWGFKVSGAGAATDLVLQEQSITPASNIESKAEALVLTEWKKVKDPNEFESLAQSAKKQAGAYTSGILSPVELRLIRYLVFVSKKQVPALHDDVQENGITYRHINIAVDPATPSKL